MIQPGSGFEDHYTNAQKCVAPRLALRFEVHKWFALL